MAEVEDVYSWSGPGDLSGRQRLSDADWFVDLGLEDAPVFGKEIGPAPTAGRGGWFTPAGNLLPSVVTFPVIEVGRENGTVAEFPGAVGDDGDSAAADQLDFQPGEELRVLAIEVAVFLPEEVAAVPAVAENGAKLVGAGLKEFGDIGGKDLNALSVVRPAWHEEVATDFLTVKVKFGDAQRGPVQGGTAYGLWKKERFPKKGAWLFSSGFPFSVSDPLCALERHRFLTSGRRGAGNTHLVPKISTKMTRGAD